MDKKKLLHFSVEKEEVMSLGLVSFVNVGKRVRGLEELEWMCCEYKLEQAFT